MSVWRIQTIVIKIMVSVQTHVEVSPVLVILDIVEMVWDAMVIIH